MSVRLMGESKVSFKVRRYALQRDALDFKNTACHAQHFLTSKSNGNSQVHPQTESLLHPAFLNTTEPSGNRGPRGCIVFQVLCLEEYPAIVEIKNVQAAKSVTIQPEFSS